MDFIYYEESFVIQDLNKDKIKFNCFLLSISKPYSGKAVIKPGFHYTANATTTTQKLSDYKVEQSSFTLIALFWLEIGRCRGHDWLNGNQALLLINDLHN